MNVLLVVSDWHIRDRLIKQLPKTGPYKVAAPGESLLGHRFDQIIITSEFRKYLEYAESYPSERHAIQGRWWREQVLTKLSSPETPIIEMG